MFIPHPVDEVGFPQGNGDGDRVLRDSVGKREREGKGTGRATAGGET